MVVLEVNRGKFSAYNNFNFEEGSYAKSCIEDKKNSENINTEKRFKRVLIELIDQYYNDIILRLKDIDFQDINKKNYVVITNDILKAISFEIKNNKFNVFERRLNIILELLEDDLERKSLLILKTFLKYHYCQINNIDFNEEEKNNQKKDNKKNVHLCADCTVPIADCAKLSPKKNIIFDYDFIGKGIQVVNDDYVLEEYGYLPAKPITPVKSVPLFHVNQCNKYK